ncbi:MAG: NAD(P)-dependent glycerol-3-phosphate dehydrogenase [Krumholzibacteria bacterium]|nr:NAD(P)-dependent glycerol-3-phosphate dehydrogenase [Candidatus Krumholzibacteria bacterium]
MKAAILGTGAWASAFGRHLCHKWERVVLWGVKPEQVDSINQTGTNPAFLPGILLPPNLRATLDLDDCLSHADVVFSVVPSQVVREVMAKVAASEALPRGVPVINLAKGFEVKTLERLSQVIDEELARSGRRAEHPVGVLLGPSHAEEVALELPTAVVLSGQPGGDWSHWQTWISGPFFRVYTNADMTGVEIATGFKNIIALAVGMADGLGTGDNTRGTIMTRGMVELSRLGCALGGRPETFSGLAGFGDMITTCISRHSRNRNFGQAVTEGTEGPQKLLERQVQVVEGVYMTQAALKLSEKHGIELPITKQVHDVLFSGKPPRQAMRELMERQLRPELE